MNSKQNPEPNSYGSSGQVLDIFGFEFFASCHEMGASQDSGGLGSRVMCLGPLDAFPHRARQGTEQRERLKPLPCLTYSPSPKFEAQGPKP